MRSRLFAAWMTYWSSPSMLLLALLWLACLVGPMVLGPIPILGHQHRLDMGQVFYTDMVLALAMVLHVMPQFADPMSRLRPGFTLPHTAIAVAWQVVSILGLALLLWIRGTRFLSSLTVTSVIIATWMWVMYGLASALPRGAFGETHGRRLIGVACLMLPVGVVVVTIRNPELSEALFSALTDSNLALFLLPLSIAAIVAWNMRLPGEAQRYAHAGLTAAFTTKEQNAAAAQRQSRVTEKDDIRWSIFTFSDSALAVAVHQDPVGFWQQLRLWRAGVQRSGPAFWLFVIPACIAFNPLLWRYLPIVGSGQASEVSSRGVISLLLPTFCVLAAFDLRMWWYRMSTLPRESLRPMTRPSIRQLMFAGTLRDVWPVLTLSLIGTALIWEFSTPDWRTPTYAIGLLLFWGSVMMGLYAFLMWALTVRPPWIIFATGMSCQFFLSALAILTVFLLFDVDEPVAPEMTLAVGAVLIVPNMLGLVYVWRRWGTVEFGKLDR